MTRRTFSRYAAAFLLLLSFSFVAHAGHTVNIVACSTPLSDLPWYWNSAVGVWDGGIRMFKPTHAVLLFRDGNPIYNDCFYFNQSFMGNTLQACTRETFLDALEWARWQGSLDIVRPGIGDGNIREGHHQGDPNMMPCDPAPPPPFPCDFPRERELGPDDALNVFILGGVGGYAQGHPFWRIKDPDLEYIYFTDLAEAIWAAAGKAQLRVYAQISRGRQLCQELEARRQGRPLFCMWATEGSANYLADALDQNGNPKPQENACTEVDHLSWWLDRVACYWESAFARFPGDWNHYMGPQIDGILGMQDGKVCLSEAAAYDISLNSYRASVHGPSYVMTPGFVLDDAEDIVLYRVNVAPEFAPHCYQLAVPPEGCSSGNWYSLAWNGDPARQYGIYYMPPNASFPLLELYESGHTSVPDKPPCLGNYDYTELPNWAFMTSDFDTLVSVARYAPNAGTLSGQFIFPGDGYIIIVDAEAGLASAPIDLSVQLAPPPEPPKSPLASLGLCGPNPFNPTTDIVFEMSGAAPVKVVVFDLLGRTTATLFDDYAASGEHRVRFDGTNLASGQYFVRATCGGNCLTQKLLLLK